jgi:hypothetical protein
LETRGLAKDAQNLLDCGGFLDSWPDEKNDIVGVHAALVLDGRWCHFHQHSISCRGWVVLRQTDHSVTGSRNYSVIDSENSEIAGSRNYSVIGSENSEIALFVFNLYMRSMFSVLR